ncbi:hypothetical protein K474DRAFT_1703951 [Panus rudis PR-1116 ss-1]|nr:hypothetical protein K474DRAFT_1703951 [Panus rudis PR-1116 ss-1]
MPIRDHPDEAKFTVHFWHDGPSEAFRDMDVVYETGLDEISEACEGPWCSPRGITGVDPSMFAIGKNCFEYSLCPPHVPSSSKSRVADLQEWDTNQVFYDDHEVFLISELEEFYHERTQEVCATKRSMPESISNESGLLTPPSSAPNKRVKLDHHVDPTPTGQQAEDSKYMLGTLYDVIPKPHFVPNTPNHVDNEGAPQDAKFFPGSHPQLIPGITMEHVSLCLHDPFARFTWVIPVRGQPPFAGCTSARIFSKSYRTPAPRSPSDDPDWQEEEPELEVLPQPASRYSPCLSWTIPALNTFWRFLVMLKEAKKLGQIALAFHAAPPEEGTQTPREPSMVQRPERVWPSTDATVEKSNTTDQTHNLNSLYSVDHIKIYHSPKYTHHLRNVLNAWWYAPGHPPNSFWEEFKGTKADKIRVLRRSRFVLLDDRGKPLLTC